MGRSSLQLTESTVLQVCAAAADAQSCCCAMHIFLLASFPPCVDGHTKDMAHCCAKCPETWPVGVLQLALLHS